MAPINVAKVGPSWCRNNDIAIHIGIDNFFGSVTQQEWQAWSHAFDQTKKDQPNEFNQGHFHMQQFDFLIEADIKLGVLELGNDRETGTFQTR